MKIKFLSLWIIVFQILFFFNILVFAEAPKNYLKGKFYKTVKNHFLVATDKMADSRFKETVIIMLDNNEEGSWGLVINKPLGFFTLDQLTNISEDAQNEIKELYTVKIPVFWGGPVEENKVFILHSNEYKNDTTKNYKNISISRDYKTLFDIVKKKGPKNSLVILGYAGWGRGQLEGEMEGSGWILSEFNFDLIFNKNSEQKWIKAHKNGFIRL